jgi:hypothetical protein
MNEKPGLEPGFFCPMTAGGLTATRFSTIVGQLCVKNHA